MLKVEYVLQKLREKGTGQHVKGLKEIKKGTAWRRDMVATNTE